MLVDVQLLLTTAIVVLLVYLVYVVVNRPDQTARSDVITVYPWYNPMRYWHDWNWWNRGTGPVRGPRGPARGPRRPPVYYSEQNKKPSQGMAPQRRAAPAPTSE